MEPLEKTREYTRPDWLPIFLGVTTKFALMGAFSIFGTAMRLQRLNPNDSILLLVCKLLWLIGIVSMTSYIGGFITGITSSVRNRTAATMNGLIVTQLTILIFVAVAWSGVSPVPGLIFRRTEITGAPEGTLWWAMMLAVPNLFAAVFGAIHGNDQLRPEQPAESAAELQKPLPQTRKAA